MAAENPATVSSQSLEQAQARITQLEAEVAFLRTGRQSATEDALREINTRLKFKAGILASTDDAVVALDSQGLIRYFNAGAERLYGVSFAEVSGKPVSAIYEQSFFTPEDGQRAVDDLVRNGRWKGQSKHILKSGAQIIVSSTVNLLSPEEGGGTVAIIRDISQYKRSELAAQDYTAQLARANQDLLHFAYAVSHDLQSPLRTIRSISQLLALKYEARLEEQGGQFIKWISQAGNRMDTMLNDLLEYAKVAGSQNDFNDTVSLNQAVNTALESLRGVIEETKAIISSDPLPDVVGEAGQLAQLLQNLLGNSLKYRKPDVQPQIHIAAERQNGEWVVTVRDNGIGFNPRHAERIFGVFQRLHTNEFAGTGIGLSICKRIAERHGGRIWAASEPDQGSAFSFSVPIDKVPAVLPAALAEQADAQPVEVVKPSQPLPRVTDQHLDELFQTLELAQAVIRDMDGTILIWTHGAEQLFGWPATQAVGQRVHQLLKTEFPKPLTEIEALLLHTNEWAGEIKVYRQDGSAIWLASHWALHRDGSDRPQSIIEVHNDITGLKDAEAALLNSSQQRDLALSAGQMAIFHWDSRSGAVHWSHVLEGFLGMEPGSFEGTFEAVEKRTHPDDRQLVQDCIAEAFENGPEYTVENRFLRNDGTYCWIRGQGRVLFDNGKRPCGIVGVVWDISQRKQNESDRQFLLDLTAKLAESSDHAVLTRTAVTELGAYLGASNCLYSEFFRDTNLVVISKGYNPGFPSAEGNYSNADFGSFADDLFANRVIEVTDSETDPRSAAKYQTVYRPLGSRAVLSIPLCRDGILRAAISVARAEIHVWQQREIDLATAVGDRLWPALENARLLQLTRERQARFESTFEQAAVGMAHADLNGRWMRVNQRMCQITGYTKEELLELSFQGVTHPDDLGRDLKKVEELRSGETRFFSVDKRYLHKNGAVVWIQLTVAMIRDEAGVPQYTTAVVEDITARHMAERQLQESNALATLRTREIEAIYAQAPVGLLFLDRELRFVRLNNHLAEINGLSVADHLGRHVCQVLPQLGPVLEPVLKRVIETREPIINQEFSASIKPGLENTWAVSYFPVEDPDGAIVGLNGVVQDITKRKEAETALLQTAERLTIATSAAQLGVFTWDAQSDVYTWENSRVYEIFGRKCEESPVSKSDLLNIIHPGDAQAFDDAMADSIKSHRQFYNVCRIRRADGIQRHVEFCGQFHFAGDGSPMRLTGVLGDVTDRIKSQQAAQDRKQLLLRVLDSLYTFVAVASPAGLLLDVNRAPLDAAGIQAVNVLGKFLPETHWCSHSADSYMLMSEAIHKAQSGEMCRFDFPARMKESRVVTLDFMISPLRDDSGQIEYLICSAVPIEERKQMEQALRSSEERYSLAEWATNDGLWDWNTTNGECYFSPRFKALVGFDEGEMENRPEGVFDRVHPDDAHILHEGVRLHFEEGQPYDIEVRLQCKDGSYRWFRSRGQAVRDKAGNVVRMLGSMGDVHHRKQAEIESRQHDEQLRRMMDSIDLLVWMAHADGSIFWYNRRWYEYTGTTPEQMEGWGWRSVHDPQFLDSVMERWTDSIRTGRAFEMVFPLRGADGVFRSFLTRIVPVQDSTGKVASWFGTNTNVDTIRREQDLLLESERKLRELAESLPELVWVADATGGITYYNRQWIDFTGIELELGLDARWAVIIHPDDIGNLRQLWHAALIRGDHYECEARVRRRDGAYRWFLSRAEPLRDESGQLIKWLGTATDIHNQKKTEQALRRSNDDLEQFAYAASHDLQEPLRTVSLYTQLLARKHSDNDVESYRFSRYIINAASRMESLLKGLLAYSRAGELADGASTCAAGQVLNSARQSLATALASAGATITNEALPAVAIAEMDLLEIFKSLIGNAIKYRSTRAVQIHVSAEREGRWQKFAVSDNGIGIQAEYLVQIFGMFKRLHREEYPGVGVGLAICKRIVQRNGGRIWAESELGKGATFYFALPAVDKE